MVDTNSARLLHSYLLGRKQTLEFVQILIRSQLLGDQPFDVAEFRQVIDRSLQTTRDAIIDLHGSEQCPSSSPSDMTSSGSAPPSPT